MVLTDKTEITKALSLYDKCLFWEYSEREIPKLSPELIVPRVTRYGTLKDIVRLFLIFPVDVIQKVVCDDRELDKTEKAFLNYVCVNGLDVTDYVDSFVPPENVINEIRRASLLDIGVRKLDVQNRRCVWKDLIELNVITEIHPLIELLSVYNLRFPPLPVKQCYMALVKNLEHPPAIGDFPIEIIDNNSTPATILSSLKKKSIEVYKSILWQQKKEAIALENTSGENKLHDQKRVRI